MNICLHWFASVNKNILFSWINRNLLCKFAFGLPAMGYYKKYNYKTQKLFEFISFSFYRAKIECLFIFQGRIAGYVTANKEINRHF